eukprot:1023746-Amphidinium_carterae.1
MEVGERGEKEESGPNDPRRKGQREVDANCKPPFPSPTTGDSSNGSSFGLFTTQHITCDPQSKH